MRPSEVSKITSTVSVESSPRLSFVNSRAVGCSRPTHMTGEVADAPGGSFSELTPPPTFHGSLPETTDAPPDSDQDLLPASKLPPGTSW